MPQREDTNKRKRVKKGRKERTYMLMNPSLFSKEENLARWKDEREDRGRVAMRTTSGRGVASICKGRERLVGRVVVGREQESSPKKPPKVWPREGRKELDSFPEPGVRRRSEREEVKI